MLVWIFLFSVAKLFLSYRSSYLSLSKTASTETLGDRKMSEQIKKKLIRHTFHWSKMYYPIKEKFCFVMLGMKLLFLPRKFEFSELYNQLGVTGCICKRCFHPWPSYISLVSLHAIQISLSPSCVYRSSWKHSRKGLCDQMYGSDVPNLNAVRP